ncbi:MAG: LpxI family protein [Deltaproteobacteria bacterium]|nr:MAG: LpxI family protein [Deltaproteobacteria bacterium]
MKAVLGLIAGNGKLPILLSRGIRKDGHRLAAIGHIGETRKDLLRYVDTLRWVQIGQLDEIINYFRSEKVREVLMAGGISKTHFFSRLKPDARALKVLSRLKDKKDDALLRGISEELENEGFRVISPAHFLRAHFAPKGCWSERQPTEREKKDISFGWELAKQMGLLDIGQSVVVKDQIILAIEAIEGTDAAIRRGGKLGRGEVAVIKVCKPTQDQRFDLPVIGLSTLRVLKKAGGSLLVVEAEKTLVMDKDKVIREADRNRICLVGL